MYILLVINIEQRICSQLIDIIVAHHIDVSSLLQNKCDGLESKDQHYAHSHHFFAFQLKKILIIIGLYADEETF